MPTPLDYCFRGQKNSPDRQPSSRRLTAPPTGTGFEARAFAALFLNADSLGIQTIHRCNAARVDGYLVTQNNEIILVEMKETLSWGSTQSATFQFLAGRKLLKLNATRGIIVFERLSDEWQRELPYGAWGQLALHASEIPDDIITLGALKLTGQVLEAPPSALLS